MKHLRIRVSVVEMDDDYRVQKNDELHVERILAAKDYQRARERQDAMAAALAQDISWTIARALADRTDEKR